MSVNRRDFLKNASAATLSALAAGNAPQLWAADRPTATADTVILLWMAGGMAQTETFDPKAYEPFETGMDPRRVLSTFPSIDTKVDNIKLSKGLEEIGSVADKLTLLRTYQAGDLGHILHSRHQFHWHTGYTPPQSVAAPHLGAVISRTLGPKNPDIPAFIDIGQNLEIGAESDSLKAFHTAGFLGSEHGPFFITDPMEAAQSVRPAGHMTKERFQARYENYKKLLEVGSQYQQESLKRSMENAHQLPSDAGLEGSLGQTALYRTWQSSPSIQERNRTPSLLAK